MQKSFTTRRLNPTIRITCIVRSRSCIYSQLLVNIRFWAIRIFEKANTVRFYPTTQVDFFGGITTITYYLSLVTYILTKFYQIVRIKMLYQFWFNGSLTITFLLVISFMYQYAKKFILHLYVVYLMKLTCIFLHVPFTTWTHSTRVCVLVHFRFSLLNSTCI